jgi:uncharacterized protein YxeA
MKKVKIALTSLTLVLAIAGVVVAKANESKRFAQSSAFYQDTAGNWKSITANNSVTPFEGQTATQAFIQDKNGNAVLLYLSAGTGSPAQFVKP